jgi:hypothetical protein
VPLLRVYKKAVVTKPWARHLTAALKWNDGSSSQNDKHSLDTAPAAISGYCGLRIAHLRETSEQICSNIGSCREVTWTTDVPFRVG